MRSRLVIVVAAAVLCAALAAACAKRPAPPAAALPWQKPGEATFTGRESCVKCHEKEDRKWAPSDHALAMQAMNEKTVLANFDGTSFTYHGVTSTFTKKDGKYFVRTDAPDGKLTDFPIEWTFGFRPLQQFLILFPKGRVQALNVCWDTRPKEKGGQRWFHLYPNENVAHDDVLHWTGPYQNWNFMCADCHSTNVKKGYDGKTDTYNTTFSEINVSCEACHGPGSAHVAWGEAEKRKEVKRDDPANGVLAGRKDRDGSDWVFAPGAAIARRTVPRTNRDELTMCARCHARRSVVHEPYSYGVPFLDTHRPALLTDPLYFADGQIRDEVYEYASFLQSRMYAEGVTCTDCHDAHTMKVRVSPDGICSRCHLPEKYAAPAHHFHKATSTGASCVACHMATRDYMVVDPRRDHSFRIPRPDLTLSIGTPNACTTPCHVNKSVAWSADAARKWWPPKSLVKPPYGLAIHAGREVLAGAREGLVGLVADLGRPAVVRATAATMLTGYPGPDADKALAEALRDPEPLVRMGAVAGIRGADPQQLLARLFPLLRDPIRTVRIDAARALAGVPEKSLSAEQKAAIASGLVEWRASLLVDEDRPEAHLSLGALDAETGNTAGAEAEYKRALAIAPGFPPTYVNLADLYRQTGRDGEALTLLRQGIAITPRNADLHHALGLLYVREKRLPDAIAEFAKASELRPDSPRYAYVYGVALESAGRGNEAISVMKTALARHTGDPELLLGLSTFCERRGDRAGALEYAKRLLLLSPSDRGAQQLVARLSGTR
jgi:tetratricopeptide (TPR) repeat protein